MSLAGEGCEDLAGAIGAAARPWVERRAALEELHRSAPRAIGRLRARGPLPAPPWPAREQWGALAGDERFVTAVHLPLAAIVGALESDEYESVEAASHATAMRCSSGAWASSSMCRRVSIWRRWRDSRSRRMALDLVRA